MAMSKQSLYSRLRSGLCMKAAFDRVKLPLIGIFGIVFITLIAFAVVRPDVFHPRREVWSITGNAVADDALFDGKITAGGPCASLDDPVCGADGTTYQNLCEARKAGVDMRHRGACEGEWVQE
jgi:hypothetical protein